jgi:inhibitor of KinA sporulation pathway (predicted exonuclease)
MYSSWYNQVPLMQHVPDLSSGLAAYQNLLKSQMYQNMTGPLLPPLNPRLPWSPFDFYAVLDFECTCERGGRVGSFQHDIIEFPVVFLNARTLEVEMEFRRYVKPTEKPILSTFCKELTGIDQGSTENADTLDIVMLEFEQFLGSHGLLSPRGDTAGASRTFAIVTDGPWDVLSFLRKECQRKSLPIQPYWNQFVDLRHWFAAGFGVRRCGVSKMLELCGLKFQGREHSGIDDARNIARITAEMIRAGCPLVCESWENRAYLPSNIY